MRARTFFISVAAFLMLALAAVTAIVVAEDPLFTVNGLAEGETAVFSNQRYEMPGLIRNQEYSSVVMGTSLAANFRASWFTEGLGEPVQKITFPDGWITEFDRALGLAYQEKGTLNHVYFCLDPNILIRPDSQRDVELPEYLYNDDPVDDLQVILSADALALIGEHRFMGSGRDLDSAYIWDVGEVFGKEFTLKFYPRPQISDAKLPEDAYRAACEENLAVIEGWLTDHPDTEFTIWFPPYSILYWDTKTREGSAEAVLRAVEYAAERLLTHSNVTLCSFLDANQITQDLEHYTDYIHCSPRITHWMAREMLAGKWRLTKENYQIRLDELWEVVANYDYDRIFEAN